MPVAPRKIMGVYDYETDTTMNVPKSPSSHQICNLNYNQWVGAFNEGHRSALKDLKNKIIHVSYPEFQKSLAQTIKTFKGTVPKKFSCVAFVQPNKSQKWVTEIAMTMGLKANAYVCIGEEGANNLEYSLQGVSPKDKRFQNCVIIDDGSYSGNQMANNISGAYRILKTKFAAEPVFHVLIPYATSTAVERINNLRDKGINVNLYWNVLMPSVSESIKPEHLEKSLDVLWPNSPKKDQQKFAGSAALYWFDHKVPNSMSFPDVLARGIVTQPKGAGIEDIPFIPNVLPPYKTADAA